MAEQDVTGRAVTRAADMIVKIRSRINAAIPLGPDKTEVTPTELRKTYDQMSPGERAALAASQGGIEEAMEIMNGPTP